MVLEDLHGHADHPFVEPAAKALWLRVLPVNCTHAHIAKERLDISRDGPVPHPEPGVDGELARRHIDAPVCAHETVHAGHVDVIDAGDEVHVPSSRSGAERHGDGSITRPHEPYFQPATRP